MSASKLLQELLLTWLYRLFSSKCEQQTLAPSEYTHTFSNYPVWTHTYTNTHEQQPYCLGTLSQMTEWSAERRVRQETGWLADGPLLRVATIRRTTNSFLFISHTTNVLLFKFRCNIFIGVRIIKEKPGSLPSGTHCTIHYNHTVCQYFDVDSLHCLSVPHTVQSVHCLHYHTLYSRSTVCQ